MLNNETAINNQILIDILKNNQHVLNGNLKHVKEILSGIKNDEVVQVITALTAKKYIDKETSPLCDPTSILLKSDRAKRILKKYRAENNNVLDADFLNVFFEKLSCHNTLSFADNSNTENYLGIIDSIKKEISDNPELVKKLSKLSLFFVDMFPFEKLTVMEKTQLKKFDFKNSDKPFESILLVFNEEHKRRGICRIPTNSSLAKFIYAKQKDFLELSDENFKKSFVMGMGFISKNNFKKICDEYNGVVEPVHFMNYFEFLAKNDPSRIFISVKNAVNYLEQIKNTVKPDDFFRYDLIFSDFFLKKNNMKLLLSNKFSNPHYGNLFKKYLDGKKLKIELTTVEQGNISRKTEKIHLAEKKESFYSDLLELMKKRNLSENDVFISSVDIISNTENTNIFYIKDIEITERLKYAQSKKERKKDIETEIKFV